jgi:hypothetical protein
VIAAYLGVDEESEVMNEARAAAGAGGPERAR